MARGMPSMMALLGLLAVAGYKNRDKLSEMLKDARQARPGEDRSDGRDRNGGGFLSDLGKMFGGGAAAGTLSGGLNDLLDRFKQSGQSESAESWVGKGPNQALTSDQLETAVGSDVIAELSRETGLSREEILSRLTTNVPDTVDRFTPEGHVPSEPEAQRHV